MAITGKALAAMTIPHEVTDACADVHCHSHDVDELLDAGATGYLVCFECGHFYRTARELRRKYRRAFWATCGGFRRPLGRKGFEPSLIARLWHLLTVRASGIRFCQHCVHDF